MRLIASDGYEYEDIAQRLLGNPKDNERNKAVRNALRHYPRNEAQAFTEGYDKARGPNTNRHKAGWIALDRERKRPNSNPRPS